MLRSNQTCAEHSLSTNSFSLVVILRLCHYLNYTASMVGWLMNRKGFGRMRLQPIRDTTPVFTWRGYVVVPHPEFELRTSRIQAQSVFFISACSV
jgi:hypothetical protein